EGPVVLQGGGVATDRGRIDIAGIGPPLQVGQVRFEEFLMIQSPLALAGRPEMVQPFLNLPGAKEGGHEVAVNGLGKVAPGGRIPPLQEVPTVTPVDPNLARGHDSGREGGNPLEAVLLPVFLAPRTVGRLRRWVRILGIHDDRGAPSRDSSDSLTGARTRPSEGHGSLARSPTPETPGRRVSFPQGPGSCAPG